MAGLDPAIQPYPLKYLVFFWMAGSEPGHDDGIGGNIRVIKLRIKEVNQPPGRLMQDKAVLLISIIFPIVFFAASLVSLFERSCTAAYQLETQANQGA